MRTLRLAGVGECGGAGAGLVLSHVVQLGTGDAASRCPVTWEKGQNASCRAHAGVGAHTCARLPWYANRKRCMHAHGRGGTLLGSAATQVHLHVMQAHAVHAGRPCCRPACA